jgi:histidyl-tRNA synthetase
MTKIINAVKGTRDFYPEEMAIRSWLYENMRRVSESFGYQEYEGPYLEYLDLYAAKSGEELVKDQSFVFQDRSGEWITLRPELTPTLARMIAQKQQQLTFPLRWWSYGPMWRYERPQRGRAREFFQWNIDLIGPISPAADAELAAIAASFFKSVDLSPDQITIFVNNRRLLDQQLEKVGIAPQDRAGCLRLIDRREKMKHQAWTRYAQDEFKLSSAQVDGILAMLDNKNLWMESEELTDFFQAIESLGFSDYIKYSPGIVRGLDYYTGTVFEAHDYDGEFRAIMGGGRYDNLVADVGGEPLPGVGFAMGDMVVSLVLAKFNRLPSLAEQRKPLVLVTVFNSETLQHSMRVSQELRNADIAAISMHEIDKLGKQFRYADRVRASVVVVLGPEEIQRQSVTVKDLISGEQVTVARAELVSEVRRILAGAPAS